MTDYARQLAIFHDAVVGRQQDALLALIKEARAGEITKQTRLDVYAKGYIERLADATLMDYPTLAHYMGEEECEKLIRTFAETTPSTHWDLNLYPVMLAEYMDKLNDVDKAACALAQLESAMAEVFWLPESKSLSPQSLMGLDEQAMGAQTFRLRTASCLLKLDYAANAYLQAFREDKVPETIEETTEYLLVIRHEDKLRRWPLDEKEYMILAALQEGSSFNEALEKAGDPEELAASLPTYIGKWLKDGVFCAL
ncbi:MAG: putative DNA-binding domain-containing protein [Rickettsiales bacterium]